VEKQKTYEELLNELMHARQQLTRLESQLDDGRKQVSVLQSELDDARIRLDEASDTIDAIRGGEVDALVIQTEKGTQLYTLQGSDQTYRIIIEQMSEGAVTVNRDGLIVYCNSQFARMLGTGMEKVTGEYFYNFVNPADTELFSRLFDNAWNGAVKGELSVRDSNGVPFPVLLSLNPLHLEDAVFLSLILTDLTIQKEIQRLLHQKNNELEQAQEIARNLNVNLESTVMERTRDLEISVLQKTLAEKELRRNQEQLTRILETMEEGVQIIDSNGSVTYANPMAQKILGITYSSTENLYIDPGYPKYKIDGNPLEPENDPLIRVLRTGKPVHDFEIGVQPPDQPQIYISLSAAPLKDEAQQVIGSVGTFMDVTQRRKVIQQKDEFISVASHELKTPVTSLKASLQLLDEIKDNTKSSETLIPKLITQANKSLNKLSVLIEDLLNVSKIRSGQLALNKQRIRIYETVVETCEELHQQEHFTILVEGEQDLHVFADPDKIEQVLVNFLNNAMKYAAESKEIRVVIARLNGSVKVSVIDNGMGIPSDKIPHLFDRYYRVDNSGTQYSGLGLGLYICSEIIKKHNGRIGAESKLENGSIFWFSLPEAP